MLTLVGVYLGVVSACVYLYSLVSVCEAVSGYVLHMEMLVWVCLSLCICICVPLSFQREQKATTAHRPPGLPFIGCLLHSRLLSVFICLNFLSDIMTP